MRYCIQCNSELPEEAEFCSKCGAQQQSVTTSEALKHVSEPEQTKNREYHTKADSNAAINTNIPSDVKVETQDDPDQKRMIQPKTKGNVKSEKDLPNLMKTAKKNNGNSGEDQTHELASTGSVLLLFLALLSISVMPGILESLIMLMTKHSMSQLVVLVIELTGMLLGLILLSQYLSTVNKGSKTRERMLMAGTGILWMYVIATVTLRLLEVLETFAFSNRIQLYWVYYILYWAIIFVALAAMSRILSRVVNRLMVVHPGKLIRRPMLFWRTLLLLGAALFFIPDLVAIIFSGEFIPLPLSFVGTVTEWVVTVYVQAVILKLTVDDLVKAPDIEGVLSEEISNQKFKRIMPLVAVGLVAALLIYDLMSAALFHIGLY